MENNAQLIAQCEALAKVWLSPAFDEETRKEVQAMLDNPDKSDLIDAFYQNLEFGTGGLRGIMGAGTNRMNKYIVGMATQGFANYINKAFPGKQSAVVVGLPTSSRLTASRFISSKVCVLRLRFRSLSVSSAVRLVSMSPLPTTHASTMATRLTGTMALRCWLRTTRVSSTR